MRRNFADILTLGGVDIAAEYHSLYMLVYERGGFFGDMTEGFRLMPFAGTAYNLKDFNERHGFCFEDFEYSDDLDCLLLFCEYVYNFAVRLLPMDDCFTGRALDIRNHIDLLADKLGHRFVEDKGFQILVPVNDCIAAAAEVAPENFGVDLLRFDYRNMRGDLDSKRKILSSLAVALESSRPRLNTVAKAFAGDYFYLLNNFNIRHNNVDAADSDKYRERVANMTSNELEAWYDLIRDMSAAAFLLLEYWDKKDEINETKQR